MNKLLIINAVERLFTLTYFEDYKFINSLKLLHLDDPLNSIEDIVEESGVDNMKSFIGTVALGSLRIDYIYNSKKVIIEI